MAHEIPDSEMPALADFIAGAMGLNFPAARWNDLRRGVAAAARELGFTDPLAWARNLMSAPLRQRDLDVLADHLTVGETYFFREPKSFDLLANVILPELIAARQNQDKRLRLWSAACCTGEEAYSIAMVLRQTLPDIDAWNLTLLATDINPRFLRKAQRGVYGEWSFRDCPPAMKARFFQPVGHGQFAITPEIRQMVRFANLNLVEDGYPSLANDTNAMDVIFCRNVLMYFTHEQAVKVVEKLHRAQLEGGWLLVGATELSATTFKPYAAVNFPQTTVYRRQSRAVRKPFDWDALRLPVMVEPPAEVKLKPVQPPSQPAPVAEKLAVVADDQQARSLANEGKLTEALEYCDRWIARDKLNAPAHYLRAVILEEQGQIAPAAHSLRAAIYLDPTFVLAHFALGNLSRRRGHPSQADKHLKMAHRLAARYPDDQVLPESDGITAGRFAEMVQALLSVEVTA